MNDELKKAWSADAQHDLEENHPELKPRPEWECWLCHGTRITEEVICAWCEEGEYHTHCDDTWHVDVPCPMCKPIIDSLREWLGKGRIAFLRKIQEEFGTVLAVLPPGHELNPCGDLLPHPVHFREGMQVRNFLRDLTQEHPWEFDRYENGYVDLLEWAIKEEPYAGLEGSRRES